MIIIMKNDANRGQIEAVEKQLESLGFQTHPISGEMKTVIGAIGDKRRISVANLLMMEGVENVVPITRPYKLAGALRTSCPSRAPTSLPAASS